MKLILANRNFLKKLSLVGVVFLFAFFAQAIELKVESQIYSSSPDHFTGADLFKKTLPNKLVPGLENAVEKVKIVTGKSVKYRRETIRKLIWKVIQEYRKSTGEKVQVSFPDEVEVFSYHDRLSIENIKKRVELITRSECLTCEIEVKLKDDLNLSYVGFWEIETKNDNWKGEVELTLKTDRTDTVPIVIRWKDSVVVAKHAIYAGTVIKKSDLKNIKKDVTFLAKPYVSNRSKLVNRVSRKNFRVNQVISENSTKKANIIRYGQAVSMEFVDGFLSVRANAEAKGAGAIGDIIPIYIPRTKQKRMARILEEGKVRVE